MRDSDLEKQKAELERRLKKVLPGSEGEKKIRAQLEALEAQKPEAEDGTAPTSSSLTLAVCEKIEDLVSRNKVLKAIERLCDVPECRHKAILFSKRWHGIKDRERDQLLSSEDAIIEQNKLATAILELLKYELDSLPEIELDSTEIEPIDEEQPDTLLYTHEEFLQLHNVFIAYAEEDYDTAKKLYHDLEQEKGISPWMFSKNLQLSDNLTLQVLQRCSHFLVLLSSYSLTEDAFLKGNVKNILELFEEFPNNEESVILLELDQFSHTLSKPWKPTRSSLDETIKTIALNQLHERLRLNCELLMSRSNYLHSLQIDVEIPKQAIVGQAIKLNIQVHFPNICLEEEAQGTEVHENENLVSTDLRFCISGDIEQLMVFDNADENLGIPANESSERLSFLLTPIQTEECQVSVEVYTDDEIYLGKMTVRTCIVDEISQLAQTQVSSFIWPWPIRFFKFGTTTIDSYGNIIQRKTHRFLQRIVELNDDTNLEMVLIPHGNFSMGPPQSENLEEEHALFTHEYPSRDMEISPFYMSKYPITQAQWRAVIEAVPEGTCFLESEPFNWKDDKYRPAENISWLEAVEFCRRLSLLTGRNFRLPSEAEWEYACRAGTGTPFHFGETITSELANYKGSETFANESPGYYRRQTVRVGHFPPNAFGLHDMHGNVWEWCTDSWHPNYEGAPVDGQAWVAGESEERVKRGGCWASPPRELQSAYRASGHYAKGTKYCGFRVVYSEMAVSQRQLDVMGPKSTEVGTSTCFLLQVGSVCSPALLPNDWLPEQIISHPFMLAFFSDPSALQYQLSPIRLQVEIFSGETLIWEASRIETISIIETTQILLKWRPLQPCDDTKLVITLFALESSSLEPLAKLDFPLIIQASFKDEGFEEGNSEDESSENGNSRNGVSENDDSRNGDFESGDSEDEGSEDGGSENDDSRSGDFESGDSEDEGSEDKGPEDEGSEDEGPEDEGSEDEGFRKKIFAVLLLSLIVLGLAVGVFWQGLKSAKQGPELPLRSEPEIVAKPETLELVEEQSDYGFGWVPKKFISNDFEARGKVVSDHATGLMWQQAGSENRLSYEEALRYVDDLKLRNFAGYHDWRLPTLPELLSLLESEKQSNNIYINPIFDNTQGWCWSADTNLSQEAWIVRFRHGFVHLPDDETTFYVRAVRFISPEAPQQQLVQLRSYPKTMTKKAALEQEFHLVRQIQEDDKGAFEVWRPQQYLSNNFELRDSLVIDHTTSLIWQQSGSEHWLNYEDAEGYIVQLNQEKFAGYDDWRLPTIPELMSLLLPEKQSHGAYIATIFDAKQIWCWSADRLSENEAWGVRFRYGNVSWARHSDDNNYVRAVRSFFHNSSPHTSWRDTETGIAFVGIPAGCFQMGSPEREAGRDSDEGPVHEVCVNGVWLGRYEVTQGQWERVMKKNSTTRNEPVGNMTWDAVRNFLRTLNDLRDDVVYRLPTEAEWEYACRAGTTTAYSFGDTADELDEYGWYSGNSEERSHPVGTLEANPWGLYDMHGNMWEMCRDWYDEQYYEMSPSEDRGGPASGDFHVLRGGSWYREAPDLRCAFRYSGERDSDFDDFGIRLAASRVEPNPLSPEEEKALQEQFGLQKQQEGKFEFWRPQKYLKAQLAAQKKIIVDRAQGLMWQKAGSKQALSYHDAHEYIRQLNRDKFAGYTDWRLPTRAELISLLKAGKENGDLYIDPLFDATQRRCWSAEKRESTDMAWIVTFHYGNVYWWHTDKNQFVRAVRSLSRN